MILSATGTALIEHFEKLELTAYLDQRGIPTIGWGHTGPEVHIGLVWTALQAALALGRDLIAAERIVTIGTRTVLNQNQFDALVSLAFNIGAGNFMASTLRKMLNAGDIVGAGAQFVRWDFINANPDPGLEDRRLAEQKLFVTIIDPVGSPQSGDKTIPLPLLSPQSPFLANDSEQATGPRIVDDAVRL